MAKRVVGRVSMKKISRKAGSGLDRVAERAEKLRDKMGKRVEETAEQARNRAAKLAVSIIAFQKSTFDGTFKVLSQVQKQSEDFVADYLGKASWMPKEGQAVVNEWTKMLQGGRKDFQKTVDKSFDLISTYVKRVSNGTAASAKAELKKAAKKRPAKKARPRKPVALKKAVKA